MVAWPPSPGTASRPPGPPGASQSRAGHSTSTGQLMSSPRRTRRRSTASSGAAAGAARRPAGTATSRSAAPGWPGSARPRAWLPRRAWHQSADISAPVACAQSTTVSIPSASWTCCAAVSRQVKYASSSAALSRTACAGLHPAGLRQPAQVGHVEVKTAVGVPAGQLGGHERVVQAVQVDHGPLGRPGAAAAEHRPVQALGAGWVLREQRQADRLVSLGGAVNVRDETHGVPPSP